MLPPEALIGSDQTYPPPLPALAVRASWPRGGTVEGASMARSDGVSQMGGTAKGRVLKPDALGSTRNSSNPGLRPISAFGDSRSTYQVPAEGKVSAAARGHTADRATMRADASWMKVAAPVFGSIVESCTGKPLRMCTVAAPPIALQSRNWLAGVVASRTIWKVEYRRRMNSTLSSPA